MPELPRISGKDAIKAFASLGFEQVRQKGSHVVLRRGDRGCDVPLHKEPLSARVAARFARRASRPRSLSMHIKRDNSSSSRTR